MTSAHDHVSRLCSVRPDRRPGSAGNVEATRYVAEQLEQLGWKTELQEFDCLDWTTSGGEIAVGPVVVPLVPSPYGEGTPMARQPDLMAEGVLAAAGSREDLASCDEGTILVLHGQLTERPLTPRGYPFYSSAEDEELLDLIEAARPVAMVSVTGRYPELCGAVEPFPLIEDGSFPVPAADVTPEVGRRLLELAGEQARIELRSRRLPARAENVVARRGPHQGRITVIAHLDTKPGTPGALDNASGVAALLRTAELLADSPVGASGVELLAVNGEDYYAASGELRWLQDADLDQVALAVNIDGIGLPSGPSAWSLYNCSPELEARLRGLLTGSTGLVEGPPWYQSDHGIFAMRGRAALAFTSSDMETALGTVAHSPDDTPEGLDLERIDEVAEAVARVLATGAG